MYYFSYKEVSLLSILKKKHTCCALALCSVEPKIIPTSVRATHVPPLYI